MSYPRIEVWDLPLCAPAGARLAALVVESTDFHEGRPATRIGAQVQVLLHGVPLMTGPAAPLLGRWSLPGDGIPLAEGHQLAVGPKHSAELQVRAVLLFTVNKPLEGK